MIPEHLNGAVIPGPRPAAGAGDWAGGAVGLNRLFLVQANQFLFTAPEAGDSFRVRRR